MLGAAKGARGGLVGDMVGEMGRQRQRAVGRGLTLVGVGAGGKAESVPSTRTDTSTFTRRPPDSAIRTAFRARAPIAVAASSGSGGGGFRGSGGSRIVSQTRSSVTSALPIRSSGCRSIRQTFAMAIVVSAGVMGRRNVASC